MGLKRKHKGSLAGEDDCEGPEGVAEEPQKEQRKETSRTGTKQPKATEPRKSKARSKSKAKAKALVPVENANDTVGEGKDTPKPEKTKKPKKSHAVFVNGCPPDTTEKDLRRLFPKAHKVTVFHRDDRCSGTSILRFWRPSHAAAAVAASGLRLRGKPLLLEERSKNRPKPPKAEAGTPSVVSPSEDALLRSVYFSGCQEGTTEQDLIACFPTVEKVTMLQSRGKFAGRGYFLFPNASEAQAATAQPSATVRGAAVRVAMAESPEASRQRRQEQNRRTVLARPWLADTMAEADVRTAFPAVERVEVMRRPGTEHTCCFLIFPTAEHAQAAADHGQVQIQGTNLQLKLLEGGQPTSPPTKRPAAEVSEGGTAGGKNPAKKAKRNADGA